MNLLVYVWITKSRRFVNPPQSTVCFVVKQNVDFKWCAVSCQLPLDRIDNISQNCRGKMLGRPFFEGNFYKDKNQILDY